MPIIGPAQPFNPLGMPEGTPKNAPKKEASGEFEQPIIAKMLVNPSQTPKLSKNLAKSLEKQFAKGGDPEKPLQTAGAALAILQARGMEEEAQDLKKAVPEAYWLEIEDLADQYQELNNLVKGGVEKQGEGKWKERGVTALKVAGIGALIGGGGVALAATVVAVAVIGPPLIFMGIMGLGLIGKATGMGTPQQGPGNMYGMGGMNPLMQMLMTKIMSKNDAMHSFEPMQTPQGTAAKTARQAPPPQVPLKIDAEVQKETKRKYNEEGISFPLKLDLKNAQFFAAAQALKLADEGDQHWAEIEKEMQPLSVAQKEALTQLIKDYAAAYAPTEEVEDLF